MLDWLQINFNKVWMSFFEGGRCFYVDSFKGSRGTLREAIRAAMSADSKGEAR